MRITTTSLLTVLSFACFAQQMHSHKDEMMANYIVGELKKKESAKNIEEGLLMMGKDTLLHFRGVPYAVSDHGTDNSLVFSLLKSPRGQAERKFGSEGELNEIIVNRPDGAFEHIKYQHLIKDRFFSRHNTPRLFTSEIHHPNGKKETNDVSQKGKRKNTVVHPDGTTDVAMTHYHDMGRHTFVHKYSTKGKDTLRSMRTEDGRIVYFLNSLAREHRKYDGYEKASRKIEYLKDGRKYEITYQRFSRDSVLIKLKTTEGVKAVVKTWYAGHKRITDAMSATKVNYSYLELSDDGGNSVRKYWLDKNRKLVKEERFVANKLTYMCAVMKTGGKPSSVIVEEGGKSKTYKYEQATSKGIAVFNNFDDHMIVLPKAVFEEEQGPPKFKYNKEVNCFLIPSISNKIEIPLDGSVKLKGKQDWNGKDLTAALNKSLESNIPNLLDQHIKGVVVTPITKGALGDPKTQLLGSPLEEQPENKKVLSQYQSTIDGYDLKKIELPAPLELKYMVNGKWKKMDLEYTELKVEVIFPVELLN